MEVKVFGDLRKRLLKLPLDLQKILLADLETATLNRIKVMERMKNASNNDSL